jgi:hypothetical protein
LAPAKPSINAAATANDELENLIPYPFNVDSVNQLDAAALVPTNQDEEGTSRNRRAGLPRRVHRALGSPKRLAQRRRRVKRQEAR